METLRKNQRVYLHCQSGFSRSAIIASVVMAIRLKISYFDGMKIVKLRRPIAQPQMELLRREDAELVIEKFNEKL
jgi:protein-tyrosine phosphatase